MLPLRRPLLCFGLIFSCGMSPILDSAVAAPPEIATPERPPIVVLLHKVDENQLTFVFWRFQAEARQMTRQVKDANGKEQTIAYMQFFGEQYRRQLEVIADDVLAVTMDGKELTDLGEWKKREGQTMLALTKGEPLDAAHKAMFKPGTILIQPRGNSGGRSRMW